MIWYVALGGAAGSVSRFALGALVQRWSGAPFPIGTLVVNVTGCFLFGFLMRYALATSTLTPEFRALLTTGFCAGYTTFSTFSYESVALLDSGQYGRAGLYIVLSVVLSLLGTVAGFAAARHVLTLGERA
ncbi:MAG TPA: fluoride efflux transporter CrcB [Gemmatimonadaceae bacterium]|nr:fluoride efflux transporter CrcB [Gemmatimonadaceae bacterium]